MFGGNPSKVESIKQASRNLRGTLASGLASDVPGLNENDRQLIKFHGLYEGYDRDSATELKQRGEGKRIEYMIRVKIPGGMLTGAQYLTLDELAREHAGGRMRITSRQCIQLHAVAKKDLQATLCGINQALLTTFGACGDVVRTVMTTAAPFEDARHRRMRADAAMLAAELLPRTLAYHEIWVGDEKLLPEAAEEPEIDPLYGPTWLPRKFKIGIGLPENNDVDVLAANDLAVLPFFDGDTLIGYNIAVGGGLGLTHNKPHTYARLASPLLFIGPDELLETAKAVIMFQRDNGDRNDRRHARLKYVVDAMGLDAVKADLERRLGRPLEPARLMPAFRIRDLQGWHEQGDGSWFFGLPVKSGRIEDTETTHLATAFRRIMTELPTRPVLAPSQDIYFADLKPGHRERLEAILVEEGVELPGKATPLRRWAMACPALPTCGLALNEAERVLDDIVADIEAVLARHGMADERISLRITGCPNGCSRPYVGDIGLVGRTPDTYAIFLGGDFEGTRLNQRVFERVNIREIGRVLEPVVAQWARHREDNESFGNFCGRWGVDRLAELVTVAQAAE